MVEANNRKEKECEKEQEERDSSKEKEEEETEEKNIKGKGEDSDEDYDKDDKRENAIEQETWKGNKDFLLFPLFQNPIKTPTRKVRD